MRPRHAAEALRNSTMEFDTGSDLSWVQCAPCEHCYIRAAGPALRPGGVVDLLHSALLHADADGAVRSGDTIPGFVFGCGHENAGQFGKEHGLPLIGLGRKTVSMSS